MAYKIQKGLIVEKLDNNTVIFDTEKSVLYSLNQTAAEIFTWLKRGLKKEKIIEKLLGKYEVRRKQVEQDLEELIRKLIKKGIIELK